MRIKLPRMFRRRPKGLRFPNGIPRVPVTDAERLRSTPLAVLGISDCDRDHPGKWTATDAAVNDAFEAMMREHGL